MIRPLLPSIPLQADERTMLLAFLDYYRDALVDRTFGLDHEQMNIALSPSSLTLGRLISHMAVVEQIWFRVRFDGVDLEQPWSELDWETDRDAEMTQSQGWSVEEVMSQFQSSVADSRTRIEAAASLDQVSVKENGDGEKWSLRWILVHMIEEYARHCGHADLIRESIDGDVAD